MVEKTVDEGSNPTLSPVLSLVHPNDFGPTSVQFKRVIARPFRL